MVAIRPAASTAQAADRDCSDFATQAGAQDYFVSLGGPSQDPDGLDADRDGIACESLPCPCSYSTAPQLPRQTTKARITAVVDGDTVKVRTRRGKRLTVRLLGIDTPETRRPGTAVECGGKRATTNMTRLSFKRVRGRRVGRLVTLTTDPTQDRRDRYGRLLAYAKTDARKELGREQLRAGWGTVYVFEREFERVRAYRATEASTRAANRGVWRLCSGDFHRP